MIHERAVFNQRLQISRENVETFVQALYDLAEHADFAKTVQLGTDWW